MAVHTNPNLQNQVIYSVYVRAHTPEGTFRSVMDDLDRIRDLGTDIVWFMPIHPIGVKGKKGSLGCPYANRDYRTTNPCYGTMEDFKALADAIHDRGMKCMIDVVYNHTSPDSTLYSEHPEWFYKKADGTPGNKVGDWTDVIDLDYTNRDLWDYQIESLCQWAQIVDGFRCDVASFVPVEFWCKAREAVEKVRPGCIWLAESVHMEFGNHARRSGIYAARDTELYEAFDMEYDYDIRTTFETYLKGNCSLSSYTDLLNYQEGVYPANYNKMRFLENHDMPRIASFVKDVDRLVNFTAMIYFMKGTTLIYGGQEFGNDHLPSLFEQEVFPRDTGTDFSTLMAKLYTIKQRLGCRDHFNATADNEKNIAVMERFGEHHSVGVFSLQAKNAEVAVALPNGTYENLIDGSAVAVTGGKLLCEGKPIIIIA